MNKKIALFSLAAVVALAAGGSALAASNISQTRAGKTNRQPQALTETQKAELEARRADIQTKRTVVQTAIEAGDYNAWLIAQKAIDDDCPLLAKITKDNFNRYVESFKLRQQAQVIDQELGIERGFGDRNGFGFGQGRGAGRGQHNGELTIK